jgi:hypothetical protein
MKSSALAFFLLTCTGCRTTQSAQLVAIDSLLADPSTYQDQTVQITGAVVARFEATYICEDLAQVDSSRVNECLWLKPGLVGEGLGPSQLPQYHKKWVILIGRFDKHFLGHMNAYGGAIVPISVKVIGSHNKGDIPPPPEPIG